jgi:hypothetical protein
VDWRGYGELLTPPPINFAVTNILYGAAAAYGVQPWHWNFTQAHSSYYYIILQ